MPETGTVRSCVERTRTQFDGQRGFCSKNGVTDRQARSLLVALDGSKVSLDTNDLPNQLVASDTHELVHGCAIHLFGDDDRSAHLEGTTVESG